MTSLVLAKLAALLLTCSLGWYAARRGWLGGDAVVASRVISTVAFNLCVPALLMRTTLRLDIAHLPWRVVAAYFVPVLGIGLVVYAWHRWRDAAAAATSGIHGQPAAPAAHTIAATFGNAVQLGIPMASALFGESGLAVHVALVSLHALLLLSFTTLLAELDLARAHARRAGAQPISRVLLGTLRNTLVHPVVLPITAGLALNLAGVQLPEVADEVLVTLGQAVVPLCLVLIGATLAAYGRTGLAGRWRGAIGTSAIKLLVLPAAVLVVAKFGFGLNGTPLAVCVVMAAMPVGSNALIFAQRYATAEAEATAAIVLSALAFVGTAALWLALLAAMAGWG